MWVVVLPSQFSPSNWSHPDFSAGALSSRFCTISSAFPSGHFQGQLPMGAEQEPQGCARADEGMAFDMGPLEPDAMQEALVRGRAQKVRVGRKRKLHTAGAGSKQMGGRRMPATVIRACAERAPLMVQGARGCRSIRPRLPRSAPRHTGRPASCRSPWARACRWK